MFAVLLFPPQLQQPDVVVETLCRRMTGAGERVSQAHAPEIPRSNPTHPPTHPLRMSPTLSKSKTVWGQYSIQGRAHCTHPAQPTQGSPE